MVAHVRLELTRLSAQPSKGRTSTNYINGRKMSEICMTITDACGAGGLIRTDVYFRRQITKLLGSTTPLHRLWYPL